MCVCMHVFHVMGCVPLQATSMTVWDKVRAEAALFDFLPILPRPFTFTIEGCCFSHPDHWLSSVRCPSCYLTPQGSKVASLFHH